MNLTFDCPGCRKTLRIGREYAGKKGRCPGCLAVVDIPEPAAPLEEIASSGRPEADVIDAVEVAALPRSRGWTSVRTGLGLVYWGTVTAFVAVVVVVGLAVGMASLAVDMGPGSRLATALGLLMVFCTLILLAGMIMKIVGIAMCGDTSADCGGKALASMSAISWILSVLLLPGVVAVTALARIDNRTSDLMAPVCFVMSAVLALVAHLCFVILVRLMALFLQNRRLAVSASRYLVCLGLYIVGQFVLVGITVVANATEAEEARVISVVAALAWILVGAVVGFLWFLDLVNKTRTTVTKALEA